MTAGAPSWDSLLAGFDLQRIAPEFPEPAAGPDVLVRQALESAGVTAFLREAARQHEPVTVVVNDPHRGTGTAVAVRSLLAAAADAGSRPAFRLLVATGSHAFDAAARRRHEEAILGEALDRFPERRWHDARDVNNLASLGTHRLHRWVTGGRYLIGIGSLEPHYFAGCTGAHKTLTIGVLSIEDIEANHRAALSERAGPFVLEGNPVHEGLAAILGALEGAGNTLLALNEILGRGRVVAATAGAPIEALVRGLPLARAVFARRPATPADLIVARVEPPLDRTLYQADKGIKNVEAAVRDGGMILLDASCAEGIGPDRFLRLLERAPDHRAALRRIEEEGYVLGDHKAVRLRHLTDRRRVSLGIVSPHLTEDAARSLGAARWSGRAEAAAWARRTLAGTGGGGRARAILVEDAGNMTLLSPRDAP